MRHQKPPIRMDLRPLPFHVLCVQPQLSLPPNPAADAATDQPAHEPAAHDRPADQSADHAATD